MKKSISLLIICILAILLSGTLDNIWTKTAKSQSSPEQVEAILPRDIPWRDNLSIPGIETANVIGDPGNAELYVLRSKIAAKTMLPAHTHPDDRLTTVLTGVMYYGTGAKFSQANIQSYPSGSIVYTPAGTPHFLWAKDEETILQQTGMGPTEIEFIDRNE